MKPEMRSASIALVSSYGTVQGPFSRRSGSTLALATRTTKESEDGQHTVNHLRLFDIRRNDGKAIQSIPLAEFPRSVQGEVSAATFSPDNYYLAFARSDNRTQVYDCRNLSKGILYDFRHTGTARMSPGNLSYGIVKAEWVESSTRRLGLVTGGDDGTLDNEYYTRNPNEGL